MADLVSQPTSIQSVYALYREGKIFVNRRYQRKLVWTQKEKQKLIESIMNKYPIPAILFAEKEGPYSTYEIIDGLQRLHAIVSYIENQFSLEGGKYFNIEAFPTAKSFSEDGFFEAYKGPDVITNKEVSTILDYSIALSVMRNATEEEINDVFDRINTYGHRLSDQERRQAGVQNEFSNLVRNLSCQFRGDVSAETLLLQEMPSISIALPMSKHRYEIKAEEVFWVQQGILRATDLRDSLDEQCIADIVACIVGGKIIERSKDILDEIYSKNSTESERIESALEVYGAEKISDEIRYCVDEILKVCNHGDNIKLRNLIFEERNTNAFPSVFAAIIIAFHEIIIKENKKIHNYDDVKNALKGISERVNTGKKGTSEKERRKNIDTIKGLIHKSFIEDKNISKIIYNNHTVIDIEGAIRRSEIETSCYELKQGMLTLEKVPKKDKNIFDKVTKTICAIANIGPLSFGKIIIGVADKESDADRVKQIYKIDPQKIGNKYIVGINREANQLKITKEGYFNLWKNEIKNSKLSESLKSDVLSNMDYNNFHGLGVIIISIPSQKELSYWDEKVFVRESDDTVLKSKAKDIAAIAGRF